MTARVIGVGPCWYLTHEQDDWDVREWLPHYETELGALHALALEWNERRDSWLRETPPGRHRLEAELSELIASEAKASADACVELLCDGCGQADGQDGEMADPGQGVHYDPAQIERAVEDLDWTVDLETGKDYCPNCPPPPESEEDARRRPGPNFVPMFELGESS